jgi:hypothetical protein
MMVAPPLLRTDFEDHLRAHEIGGEGLLNEDLEISSRVAPTPSKELRSRSVKLCQNARLALKKALT